MVLFLFVIMLLNLGRQAATDIKGPLGLAVGVALAGVLGFQLGVLRVAGPPAAILLPPDAMPRAAPEQGIVVSVARPLLDTYPVPLEITSALLLAAIVGAGALS